MRGFLVLCTALPGGTDSHCRHRRPAGACSWGALETCRVVTVCCLPLDLGSVSSCAGRVAGTGGFGPSVQARHDLENIHDHSFGACARPEPSACPGALTSQGLSLHRAPGQLQPILDGNMSPPSQCGHSSCKTPIAGTARAVGAPLAGFQASFNPGKHFSLRLAPEHPGVFHRILSQGLL